MAKLRVIVVGGFLGSGKTTLLSQAAKHLSAQGIRVGIVTNDQAEQLVDTRFLASLDVAVGEVAGGCFCCRFEDLEDAAGRLIRDACPDVLLTEPVGSCTDISATVLQPIKLKWSKWAELSPFSVLADPRRLRQILGTHGARDFPDSIRYLIRKQFEEADCIVINKTDLLSHAELTELREKVAAAWPGTSIFDMSALTDRGVAEWLVAVAGAAGGGNRILEVDYDTYARGEAELGWLNGTVALSTDSDINWSALTLELTRRLQRELAARSAEIGHLKLLLECGGERIVANVTSLTDEPSVRGIVPSNAKAATLVINARAHIEPAQLTSAVRRSITALVGDGIRSSILHLQSLSPPYPRPTHRTDRVIPSSEPL